MTGAAANLAMAQRDEHSHRAIEPGDHVGERGRRQCRLAIGEAGARGITGHAFDQGAKAGPVAVGPVLAPPGNPQNDQAGVACVQDFRGEAHRFEGPGAEILDQHL